VLEFGDLAGASPKLYVVTVTQALGVFFRDLVIGARQIDRPDDPPVNVNDIGSIIGHSISQPLHQPAAILLRMPEIELLRNCR
jgi:hypothetical protein